MISVSMKALLAIRMLAIRLYLDFVSPAFRFHGASSELQFRNLQIIEIHKKKRTKNKASLPGHAKYEIHTNSTHYMPAAHR